MKTYQATKESANSNTVINEINAAVLTGTFKSLEGIQQAELCYPMMNIISFGTCQPVHTTHTEKCLIDLALANLKKTKGVQHPNNCINQSQKNAYNGKFNQSGNQKKKRKGERYSK